MARETTEIRIDEYGDETHESWLLINANRVTTMGFGPEGNTGARLFDSEIDHHHLVVVRVHRCTRKRQLKHDYLHATQLLLEMEMSMAQWGAFVSSFGDGAGVPATLRFLGGDVPQAPYESRLGESLREVRESGEEALASVQQSYEALADAFENGGKRAQREALRDLGIRLQNAPKNMEFAASSLTKHAENVVTKARADIEAMALAAVEHGELAQSPAQPQLGAGSES